MVLLRPAVMVLLRPAPGRRSCAQSVVEGKGQCPLDTHRAPWKMVRRADTATERMLHHVPREHTLFSVPHGDRHTQSWPVDADGGQRTGLAVEQKCPGWCLPSRRHRYRVQHLVSLEERTFVLNVHQRLRVSHAVLPSVSPHPTGGPDAVPREKRDPRWQISHQRHPREGERVGAGAERREGSEEPRFPADPEL